MENTDNNFYKPMENDRIRFNARRVISGRLWQFWQLFLVYALLEYAISWIPDLCFGNQVASLNELIKGTADAIPKEINFWPYFAYYGLNALLSLAFIPLGYGIYRSASLWSRGAENDKWKTFFSGYTSAKSFFKMLGLTVLKYLLVSLLTCLLIVPGIIFALAWSFTSFIFFDEPDLTIWQTMKKSKEMLNGYKGKLFLLGLSFIGWIILGAFTFGILYVWLYPYMLTSLSLFYDDIRRAYYNGDPATPQTGASPVESSESEHAPDADEIK